jgi:hypothetical protein
MNWYRAELDGREGLIPSNYIQMKNHRSVTNYSLTIDLHEFHFLYCYKIPIQFLNCNCVPASVSRNFTLNLQFCSDKLY